MAAARAVVIGHGGTGLLSMSHASVVDSSSPSTSGLGVRASVSHRSARGLPHQSLSVPSLGLHSCSDFGSRCRGPRVIVVTRERRDVECAARAFTMDVAEEAQMPNDKAMESLEVSYFASDPPPLKSMYPKNRADDISLNNPLLRQHRMGCGWLGLILEWEGVIVEDDADLERKSWTALAEEEGRRPAPAFILKRAEGMKNEQALSEVLCWTRDYRQLKRLALRKEELYEEMQKGTYRLLPGAREFVLGMKKYGIPIAIASTRPRKYIERAIEAVGMEGFFNEVISAEDTYRGKPDPEMYQYAAERLNFIPERCIVFGNSNTSVEAAHDALMKCVAIAGKHRMYELGAADLVIRRLDDLSMVDLKNLADLDSPEFRPPEPLPEMEEEVETKRPKIDTMER